MYRITVDFLNIKDFFFGGTVLRSTFLFLPSWSASLHCWYTVNIDGFYWNKLRRLLEKLSLESGVRTSRWKGTPYVILYMVSSTAGLAGERVRHFIHGLVYCRTSPLPPHLVVLVRPRTIEEQKLAGLVPLECNKNPKPINIERSSA